MDGWIKLHREIIDHWIYQDAEYLKVWLEMLIRARYWEGISLELVGDQLVEVDRGEFIFGRPKWSKRLGISEQRLKTLILKMLKDDMIELVRKYPRFTLYRIKNYEKFNQQNNQQDNQQETLQPSGFEECGNQQDNQQSNQRSTSSQPAPNQQPTNNKESKERSKKEKKKDIIPKIDFSDSVSMTQTEFDKLASEFGEETAKRAIEYLTSYKAEKGYKTKSDYLTIRRWVIDAVSKQKGGATFGKHPGGNAGHSTTHRANERGKDRIREPKPVSREVIREINNFE